MLSAGRFRWFMAAVLLAAFAFSLTGERQPDSRFGYSPNPDGTARFLRELDKPLFADAGADAIQKAENRNTFLYRPAYAAHQALYGRPWIVERQLIGDCVSWGWAHGVWIAQCVDWEQGLLESPPAFPSTEAIYGGSRVEARGRDGSGRSPVGGYSDGSYGGAAARWVRDWGVIYREVQDNGVDLTSYSGDRAKSWGAYGNGGQGDNGVLDEAAKAHPCEHVALVTNFDEAAAAIESGYPVAYCGGVGFTSTRDSDGFCRRSGTWWHCMCFIAVRYGSGDDGNGETDSSGRRGLLCLNSWGPSASRGPKWPADQPDGSFWVDEATVNSMLRGEDSFAVGSVQGFAWRDLDHREWMDEAQP